MPRIAVLLRLSAQTVLPWRRALAKEHKTKPEPTGRTIVPELDAMWHAITKQRHTRWSWTALEHGTGKLLKGHVGVVTGPR
jgi:hypothetical protein